MRISPEQQMGKASRRCWRGARRTTAARGRVFYPRRARRDSTPTARRKTVDAQGRSRSGQGGRCALLRDADGGSSGGYGKRRSNQPRRDFICEGWSQAAVSERYAGAESGAIRAVRNRALARMRMMVLRVGVAEFVGSAVLDDLAVSANMNVRVRENRRQRTERQCKPGEIEMPADHHEAKGSWERTPRCGA